MSIAYPQKVSSEQPFPVAGRFWQSISLRWCLKSFPLRGHCAVLRGAHMHVATCIAPGKGLIPNGDRYMHIGSLSGRALGALIEPISVMNRPFFYTMQAAARPTPRLGLTFQ